MAVTLYDYWRSSAAYRVRISLNIKGIPYEAVVVNLLTKDHVAPSHLARNPQGLVPALAIDGLMLTQSLAILDYLEETRPAPGLLPVAPALRAKVRAAALAIAMEIHPVCNLSVATHMADLVGGDAAKKDASKKAWMQHFIRKGLLAVEALARDIRADGLFLCGDRPGLFECCLVPQMYNARRWEVDMQGLETLLAIDVACAELPAFRKALPEAVNAG
jgi:maleylacetoacetate isomerase